MCKHPFLRSHGPCLSNKGPVHMTCTKERRHAEARLREAGAAPAGALQKLVQSLPVFEGFNRCRVSIRVMVQGEMRGACFFERGWIVACRVRLMASCGMTLSCCLLECSGACEFASALGLSPVLAEKMEF